MTQNYKPSDLELFEKINILNKKASLNSKEINYRHDTSLLDKKINLKQNVNYKSNDEHQFSLIENKLSNPQTNKNSKLFFSQNSIDDPTGYKEMYPHNIKFKLPHAKRPSIKVHVNEDGSLPKFNLEDRSVKSKNFKGMFAEPKYLPGGDKYLLVEFGNVMNLELNFKAQGLAKAIESAKIKGIYETLPCFASMLVHYNPDDIKFEDLKNELISLVNNLKSSEDTIVQSRLFRFPTVYLDKWTKEAVEDYIAKITYKKP
ncbi:MAG: carboxyltransferase domain-containing protein, partial [Proteobacteria bacterium]|nr:carboxyltransferase domain-containing protein [Pseudomonadota bacterium]